MGLGLGLGLGSGLEVEVALEHLQRHAVDGGHVVEAEHALCWHVAEETDLLPRGQRHLALGLGGVGGVGGTVSIVSIASIVGKIGTVSTVGIGT